MSEFLIADKADLLIVDDEPANLHELNAILAPHFNVHPFASGAALLRYVRKGYPVDIMLLDIVMPEMDGYQLCQELRSMRELIDVPIIFLTSLSGVADEERALALGASDFISKPPSPSIVVARARHHVQLGRALRLVQYQNDYLDERVAERTAELAQKNLDLERNARELGLTQDATIHAFSSLAEARDDDTGHHIRRTQNYVRELALALRNHPRFSRHIDDAVVDMLFKSAPLHDIGKVAVPDRVLLKPGKLDAEEWDLMKSHAARGAEAIRVAEAQLGGDKTFLRYARQIAQSHHERWDGKGYPDRLAGEEIPFAARLMAVADVYDALITRRVYKPAMPHERAVQIITEGRGSHFDPDVADAFGNMHGRFAEIAALYTEQGC